MEPNSKKRQNIKKFKMELTLKRTPGILGLMEFGTTEKCPIIYFENDFGMIKNGKVTIYNANAVYVVDELTNIELIEEKPKNYPAKKISLLIVLAALLLSPWNSGLITICAIATMALLFFKQPVPYWVKIISIEGVNNRIPITKDEVNDAKSFIKKYNKYKKTY